MKSIDTVLGGPCIYWRRHSQFNAFSVIDYSHTARAFYTNVWTHTIHIGAIFSSSFCEVLRNVFYDEVLQIIRPRDFVHFNI